MDTRFRHTAWKESYFVEAKMRQKLPTESFSDFPELLLTSIEKLIKENVTFLEEASHNTLLGNCYIKKISGYFWEALDQCVIRKP